MYVKWIGSRKFHSVSLKNSGSVTLDPAAGTVTTGDPNRSLMTHCGRVVPANRTGYSKLSVEEFNNEYCDVCSRHDGL